MTRLVFKFSAYFMKKVLYEKKRITLCNKWHPMKNKTEVMQHVYSKTNQCIKFILFWNDTLHVSGGLSIHRQEFKAIHTPTGICLLVYVQS